ncbi:hypothetical protein R1flu_023836 [Riccia fluitans]|uniref:Secreted protein n=1 Tax=Riccia fluitans TaxID=41844 RepID=A0ABD1XT91_9MARC
MRRAGFVVWCLKAAAQLADSRETTVRRFGAPVTMCFTCTVYSSGSIQTSQTSQAQAAVLGSMRSAPYAAEGGGSEPNGHACALWKSR